MKTFVMLLAALLAGCATCGQECHPNVTGAPSTAAARQVDLHLVKDADGRIWVREVGK